MPGDHFRPADEECWVYSQAPGDEPEDDHRPDAETACADQLATAIFNIAALSEIVPAHRSSSNSKVVVFIGSVGVRSMPQAKFQSIFIGAASPAAPMIQPGENLSKQPKV
jgi:hypothetical protein